MTEHYSFGLTAAAGRVNDGCKVIIAEIFGVCQKLSETRGEDVADEFVTKEVCILKHEKVDAVEDDIKEIRKDIKEMNDNRIATGWKILGAALVFLSLVANIVVAIWKN